MEITNSTLYVSEVKEQQEAHNTETEAIDSIKESIDDEIVDEDVKIYEVDIDGEEWTIKQVPWSKIALEMIKDNGN